MVQNKKGRGRPKKPHKDTDRSAEIGTQEGWERATFIVRTHLLNQLKDIAYWDRLKIKEVVNDSFEDTVKKYEKINGKLKSRPKK